jgi:hypothetical protein
MFGDGPLTFREFVMREPLPLARIHAAVLEFLRGRKDAVLFGAQAVNAYVDEPRMTQGVDILSPRAAELADEIREFLHQQFKIAVRVRRVKEGIGYRVYQSRQPQNRHLVDIRRVQVLPSAQRVDEVLVLTPDELISSKILSMVARPMTPKGLVDEADVRRMLLRFPELKEDPAAVRGKLEAAGASEQAISAWLEIAAQEILSEDEDAEFQ